MPGSVTWTGCSEKARTSPRGWCRVWQPVSLLKNLCKDNANQFPNNIPKIMKSEIQLEKINERKLHQKQSETNLITCIYAKPVSWKNRWKNSNWEGQKKKGPEKGDRLCWVVAVEWKGFKLLAKAVQRVYGGISPIVWADRGTVWIERGEKGRKGLWWKRMVRKKCKGKWFHQSCLD